MIAKEKAAAASLAESSGSSDGGVGVDDLAAARLSNVDVFRAVAVLMVVLYHFGWLPYGYLGVDLFFVISGLLVSRLLIRDFRARRPIHYLRFVVARGFKIWPSYYALLAIGSAFAYLAYHNSHPDQVIRLAHLPRYLFFVLNYRATDHWSFDHLWSLCVEEHFYLLLPLVFLVAERCFASSPRVLMALVALLIPAGIVAKQLGYLIHYETLAATHNRIDALAWGVLLALLDEFAPRFMATWQRPRWFAGSLFAGVAILAGSIALAASGRSPWWNAVAFHAFVPVSCFLLLGATLHVDMSRQRVLRFVAARSYNWYLWHVPLVMFFRDYLGPGPLGLVVYLTVSFGLAMRFTRSIERPFVLLRRRALDRLLPRRDEPVALGARAVTVAAGPFASNRAAS